MKKWFDLSRYNLEAHILIIASGEKITGRFVVIDGEGVKNWRTKRLLQQSGFRKTKADRWFCPLGEFSSQKILNNFIATRIIEMDDAEFQSLIYTVNVGQQVDGEQNLEQQTSKEHDHEHGENNFQRPSRKDEINGDGGAGNSAVQDARTDGRANHVAPEGIPASELQQPSEPGNAEGVDQTHDATRTGSHNERDSDSYPRNDADQRSGEDQSASDGTAQRMGDSGTDADGRRTENRVKQSRTNIWIPSLLPALYEVDRDKASRIAEIIDSYREKLLKLDSSDRDARSEIEGEARTEALKALLAGTSLSEDDLDAILANQQVIRELDIFFSEMASSDNYISPNFSVFIYSINGVASKFANVIVDNHLNSFVRDSKNLIGLDELDSYEKEIFGTYNGFGNTLSYNLTKIQNKMEELGVDSESAKTAVRTTHVTAMFTPWPLATLQWEIIRQAGFEKGQIVEFGSGSGRMVAAMPEDLRREPDVKFFGVEKDPITAAVSRALFPEHKFVTGALEEVPQSKIPPADLIVGNIPFGDIKVFDRERARTVNIHHYFMDRILDTVKPGGMVAIYNSAWIMSAKTPKARRDIWRQAEIKGVIRVSSDFIPNADMGMMDMLIIKKRPVPLPEGEPIPDWVKYGISTENPEVMQVHASQDIIEKGVPEDALSEGAPLIVMLGDKVEKAVRNISGNVIQIYTGEFASDKRPKFPADISEHARNLVEAMAPVLEDAFQPEEIAVIPQEKDDVPQITLSALHAETGINIGSIIEHEGEFRLITGRNINQEFISDEIITVKGKKAQEQMSRLIKLREHVYRIINLSNTLGSSAEDEAKIEAEIGQARKLYREFVKKWGNLNGLPASHAFRLDASWPIIQNLEAIEFGPNNEKRWAESEFLKRRVISPPRVVTHTDNSDEALTIAYAERAMSSMDIGRALSLMGEKVTGNIYEDWNRFKQVFKGLEERWPYYNPLSNLFEHPDRFLSGVRLYDKIEEIQSRVDAYDELNFLDVERSLNALKKALPPRTEWVDIDASLGVHWVPQSIYERFIIDAFDLPEEPENNGFSIEFERNTGMGWKVTLPVYAKSNPEFSAGDVNAARVLEQTMNAKMITVKGKYADGTVYVDSSATELARQAQNRLQEAWLNWVTEHEEIREKLTDIYNRQFVYNRPYEPVDIVSHIPGMSNTISLRPHQKKVITRALNQKTLLMAHGVGAGKTMAMGGIAMALKSYGLSDRAMIVVKKSTLSQVGSEIQRMFPNARILVMESQKTTGKDKARFMGQLVTADYDIAILTYETFKAIPLSPLEERRMISREITLLEDSLSVMNDGKPSFGQKRIMKKIESLKARMEKLSVKMEDKRLNTVYFDHVSPSVVIFDEAHTLKNLTVSSSIDSLSKSGSQVADDALQKIQWLRNNKDNFRLIYSTGTPISNDFTEMYGIMRAAAPDTLEKMFGGDSPNGDSFFRTFTEEKRQIMMAVDGTYKERSLINLVNVQELSSIFRSFSDVVFVKDTSVERPEPTYEMITAPQTELHKVFQLEIMRRAENIKNRVVTPEEDNYLMLATNGRDMALDPRLYVREAPDLPEFKVNLLIDKVSEIYHSADEGIQNKTQAIFLDSGTPNGKSFNLYQLIKDKLIDRGIPEDKIAFAHDAKTDSQRKKMFERVNSGEISVIIGSTEKMGVGVNMQERLYALHHLDVPRTMRPSDVEQREGRIVRQGNLNKSVKIFYYITEGSFDQYTWELIRRKSEMIKRVMSNPDNLERRIEDDGDGASYEDIVAAATGSNKVKELATLERELKREIALEGAYMRNIRKSIATISACSHNMEVEKELLELQEESLRRRETLESSWILLDDNDDSHIQTFDDEKSLRAFLKTQKEEVKETYDQKVNDGEISSWAGYARTLRFIMMGERVDITFRAGHYDIATQICLSTLPDIKYSALGNAIKAIESLPKRYEKVQKKIESYERQLKDAEKVKAQAEDKLNGLGRKIEMLKERVSKLRDEVNAEIEQFKDKAQELGANTVREYVLKNRKSCNESKTVKAALSVIKDEVDGINDGEDDVVAALLP